MKQEKKNQPYYSPIGAATIGGISGACAGGLSGGNGGGAEIGITGALLAGSIMAVVCALLAMLLNAVNKSKKE